MNVDLLHALTLEAATRPDAVVDLLLESEATLVDVLLAYAGTPPAWEDGLPQAVLAEWLARKVPPDERAVQAREAKADTQRLFNLLLDVPEYVQYLSELMSSWAMRGGAMPIDQNHPAVKKAGTRAVAIVVRNLKRRVLGLFPEVERTLEYTVFTSSLDGYSESFRNDGMKENGFRMDRSIHWEAQDDPLWGNRVCYTQTLAAPDWVPPLPAEVARIQADALVRLPPLNLPSSDD